MSAPCSCVGCLYGGSSKIYDNYDNVTKKSLWSQGTNKKHNNKVDKVLMLTMKRVIINHIFRFMYLEHYRDLIKTDSLKYFQEEDHGHQFYSIPSKWQTSLQKLIMKKIWLLQTIKEG